MAQLFAYQYDMQQAMRFGRSEFDRDNVYMLAMTWRERMLF